MSNLNLRPAKNHTRLLRHRAKMQRKYEQARASANFWLRPSALFEPKYMDLDYLWIHDQIIAVAVKNFPFEQPPQPEAK